MRKAALASLAPEVNLAQVFQQSRDRGIEHIPDIVSQWAALLRLPEKLVEEYLRNNVDYSLDEENLEGLRLYFRYAAELKILPAAPDLQFLDQPRLAARP